jgi:hypothetical protein
VSNVTGVKSDALQAVQKSLDGINTDVTVTPGGGKSTAMYAGIIGGVVGGFAVVGLVILFVVRKRKVPENRIEMEQPRRFMDVTNITPRNTPREVFTPRPEEEELKVDDLVENMQPEELAEDAPKKKSKVAPIEHDLESPRTRSMSIMSQFVIRPADITGKVSRDIIKWKEPKKEQRTVASGEFGTVSKAVWRHLNVAIKEVKEMKLAEVTKFEAEVSTIAKLRPHPNVGEQISLSISLEKNTDEK